MQSLERSFGGYHSPSGTPPEYSDGDSPTSVLCSALCPRRLERSLSGHLKQRTPTEDPIGPQPKKEDKLVADLPPANQTEPAGSSRLDPPAPMVARTASFPPESEEEARLLREDGKCLLRFAAPNSTRLWDVVIVYLYHMLPFTPAPLLIVVACYWTSTSLFGQRLGVVVFLMGLTILCTSPLVYNRKFRKSAQHLYISMARYMKDVKVIVPAKPFKNQGSHIFAMHPHGRMFCSSALMTQTSEMWRAPFLPGGELFTAVADGFFMYPVLRHVLYASGAFPATRDNISKVLQQKKHVALIPGGVKEVCLGTRPDTDVLYLRNRKGFIKLALEENTGVVPIYCFNENQLFSHDSKATLKFWENINKVVNVGVPGMRGVFGLTMPFRREVLVVVGDPLYPLKGESVDEFHSRYMDALQHLFERYVRISPNPYHRLVIS